MTVYPATPGMLAAVAFRRATGASSECQESVVQQRNRYLRQDWAFVTAMANAVRAGLERPGWIGIDTRHVGREPKYVPHGFRVLHVASVAADVAALGNPPYQATLRS